jgi:hypothetical protein
MTRAIKMLSIKTVLGRLILFSLLIRFGITHTHVCMYTTCQKMYLSVWVPFFDDVFLEMELSTNVLHKCLLRNETVSNFEPEFFLLIFNLSFPENPFFLRSSVGCFFIFFIVYFWSWNADEFFISAWNARLTLDLNLRPGLCGYAVICTFVYFVWFRLKRIIVLTFVSLKHEIAN